jgi:hypothetical protein
LYVRALALAQETFLRDARAPVGAYMGIGNLYRRAVINGEDR